MKKTKRKLLFSSTPKGLFQWVKDAFLFGLVTALATFARMMLKLRLEERSAMNFFDDILVATDDWKTHLQAVRAVMEKLRAFGFDCQSCFLATVSWCGAGFMSPEASKVKTILELGRPTTKRQVPSVLGLFSY